MSEIWQTFVGLFFTVIVPLTFVGYVLALPACAIVGTIYLLRRKRSAK